MFSFKYLIVLKITNIFHSSACIVSCSNGDYSETSLPATNEKYNFPNRIGLRYQAEACRDAILKGKQKVKNIIKMK